MCYIIISYIDCIQLGIGLEFFFIDTIQNQKLLLLLLFYTRWCNMWTILLHYIIYNIQTGFNWKFELHFVYASQK